MKTTLRRQTVVATAAAMLIVAGCTTPEGQPDRTATGVLTGGAIGAGTGAIIGSASGRAGAGALIGGAIGALTGGIIGNAMDQQQREILAQQSPQTLVRVDRGQPLGLADIKALSKAGISDEVIISQIRNSRTMYKLSTAEILDLKDSGVSDRVINFMINTPAGWNPSPPPAATLVSSPPPTPPPSSPPPQVGPVVVSAGGSTTETSLTLPPGSQLYAFAMATGGYRPSDPFASGESIQVRDAYAGYTSAELVATTNNSNSYATSTMYHTMVGFGASGFRYAQGFYSANPNPGAHSTSVQFTLTAPALVVLVGAASSQQQLTFSGLPNLVTDVPYNTVVATAIAHAPVGPGEYAVRETSLDTAAAQDPNAMVDLLGVFIFSDYPSAATSSNPQIPLPAVGSTGVSGASRPSPAPSTSEPPEP